MRYVKLAPEDFAADAEVSDEEIEAYYRTYSDEFASGKDTKPLSDVKAEIKKQLVDGKSSLLYDRFLEEFLRGKRSFSDLLSERSSLEVKGNSGVYSWVWGRRHSRCCKKRGFFG